MVMSSFLNKLKRKEILNTESNNALRDLEMIIKLTTKKNNPISSSRTNWKGALGTLKYVGKTILSNYKREKNYEESAHIGGIDDYDELKQYIKSDLEPIFSFLTLKKYDHQCNYILVKYEITFLTIKNTLIESNKTTKSITNEIKFKIIDLLYEFVKEINEIKKDDDQIQKTEINTINKSLESRLDLELDYQQKFIKTNNEKKMHKI
jgi:hypothetical protein